MNSIVFRRLYGCLCWLLLLSVSKVSGQSLVATVDKNHLALNETVDVTYSFEGNGSNFQPPAFTDFTVLSGPNSSQSMQIINGKVSQSTSYTYYLSPKKEGKFVIGPGSATIGGKRVESNSVTLEVTKANSGGSQPKGNVHQGADDNLFVRSTLNKTKVYQGEQVILTYKIYTRINLVGFQGAKIPSYTGFWSDDVKAPANYTLTKESVEGVAYNVVEFKKTCLFPQRSGTLHIDPIEIDAVVRQQTRSQDPWNFFGGGVQDVGYKINGKPVTVEVMPLPETGKPSGFSGAVGQFSLKAQLNKDKVKANEAVNIRISVSGKGNVNLIELPKIQIPPDVESYDPKPTENINVKAGGVEGSKSAEYVMIPRHHGAYKIEEAEFSYFDPEKKEYVTLHSPEFNLQVEKGDGESNSPSAQTPGGFSVNGNRSEVAVIGNDIRYIKTTPSKLYKRGEHYFTTRLFGLGYLVPSLAFLLFLVGRRKYRKDRSDLRQLKSRRATRMAQRRLETAKTHQKTGNKEKFYEEISKALFGYLGDKLYMPVSELSKESIAKALELREVSDATCRQLESTLNACEYARYAPAAASGDLQGIYDQSVRLLARLEDEISKSIKTE
jgi:hypothetical protein